MITGVLAFMQYYSAYTTTLNVPFLKQFQPDLLIHSLMGNPLPTRWRFCRSISLSCWWWWVRAMR